MAHIIVKVITIYAPKGITDGELGKKTTEAIKKKREEMSKQKRGGVFHSISSSQYIQIGKPRYKIFLAFLSFS